MNIRLAIFFLLMLTILAGCANAAPLAAAPTVSPTATHVSSSSKIQSTRIPTLTPWPTFTPGITPSPTPTLFPSFTPGPTPTLGPGPEIQFLYKTNGEIYRYDMRTWTSEKVPVQSAGSIREAELSPDGSWLAFHDEEGLKLVEKPFDGPVFSLSTRLSERMDSENHFSFSNDSVTLAYSDQDGLKILNVRTKSSYQLLANWIGEGMYDLDYYVSAGWSPNDEWLEVSHQVGEGSRLVLVHIPTSTIQEYDGCHNSIEWLNSSQGWVVAVSNFGMLGCGENDGVFLEEINADLTINEKLLYQDPSGAEPWTRYFYNVSISPDGGLAVVCEARDFYSDNATTHLILLDLVHNTNSDLLSISEPIYGYDWSADSKALFYFSANDEKTRLIQLDLHTKQKTVIWSYPGNINAFFEIQDSGWYVFWPEYSEESSSEKLFLINRIYGGSANLTTLSGKNRQFSYLGLFSDE